MLVLKGILAGLWHVEGLTNNYTFMNGSKLNNSV